MHAGMDGPHRFDVKVRPNDPETPELRWSPNLIGAVTLCVLFLALDLP